MTSERPPRLVDDLELLDDPMRHACCTACQDHPLGVPYIARCGRKAIAFRGFSDHPPPNACPDCLEEIYEACRLCGAE